MNDYESIKLIIPKSWPQWMAERYLSIVTGFHDEICDGVDAELTRGAAGLAQAIRDGQEWIGEPRLLTAEQTSQAGRMIVQALTGEED
jgi:hypothetical protein